MEGLQMRYFVLKPKGTDQYAKASRAAMRKYASMIKLDNPEMAKGLINWAENEQIAALDENPYAGA